MIPAFEFKNMVRRKHIFFVNKLERATRQWTTNE
jgi:hypothetical protein